MYANQLIAAKRDVQDAKEGVAKVNKHFVAQYKPAQQRGGSVWVVGWKRGSMFNFN